MIILDINMPKKTGLEVCQELRKNPAATLVPIMILSARSQEYDKLMGFGFGADDYITKPFKFVDLLSRVTHLLTGGKSSDSTTSKLKQIMDRPVKIGNDKIDLLFSEGITQGSNILISGQLGTGKSTIARQFMAYSIKEQESCLCVSVDDQVELVIKKLEELTQLSSASLLNSELIRIVGSMDLGMVKTLNIEDTLRKIIEAGMEIGQSIMKKSGGRRVIDSISGLFLNYGEVQGYQFLSQIVHTSKAFGDVTTIFTLSDEAVTPQQSANIKNYMDIVIELKAETAGVYAQVTNMKWSKTDSTKVKIWSKI
jgi:KaiC/GvpD/RAD55 family RecA-like ATPase